MKCAGMPRNFLDSLYQSLIGLQVKNIYLICDLNVFSFNLWSLVPVFSLSNKLNFFPLCRCLHTDEILAPSPFLKAKCELRWVILVILLHVNCCTGLGWDRVNFLHYSIYDDMSCICDQNCVDNIPMFYLLLGNA